MVDEITGVGCEPPGDALFCTGLSCYLLLALRSVCLELEGYGKFEPGPPLLAIVLVVSLVVEKEDHSSEQGSGVLSSAF